MKLTQKISLLLAASVLAGCATAPKPIYHWDNYQSTVYEYYKSDASPEQQIAALKESIEKSRAQGLPVPPCLHAHLGMLYGNTGHTDRQ